MSFNPIDHIVGVNVRNERIRQGMTQDALGEAIGVSFQQVQKYERGLNRISASRLVEIARFLAIPVAQLFEDVASQLPSEKRASLADTRREQKLTEEMVQLPEDVRKAVANLVSAMAMSIGNQRAS